MLLGALLAGSLGLGGYTFLNSARFGASPSGEELKRIERSPHWVNGVFQNELPTPLMVNDGSVLGTWLNFLFRKEERLRPLKPLPAVKENLKAIDGLQDVIVWLGHSSFYLQLSGKRILIDPVLSDFASPVPLAIKAFPGSNPYRPEDLPDIDVLLLSHDHWDHLDYPTLTALEPRISQVVCGLGVGAHLQRFGFAREKIFQGDWGDSFSFGELKVELTTGRHFSGRLFKRNRTLWAGFVLRSEKRRVFFSGDTGYGPHFAEIGRRFGPLDLVLLDMGQYNDRWKYVHMRPEEAARAADDLKAKALMPTHVGKFCISHHTWDDPFKRMTKASQGKAWRWLTPYIGQAVFAGREETYPRWWEGLV
ncbi:MAG: MBL fold metallo-hydrolase [Desulfovibrionaceae bacterium]|nr:MBL fold metallo-hydrolase [Desulfovibrionaceae bacterium]